MRRNTVIFLRSRVSSRVQYLEIDEGSEGSRAHPLSFQLPLAQRRPCFSSRWFERRRTVDPTRTLNVPAESVESFASTRRTRPRILLRIHFPRGIHSRYSFSPSVKLRRITFHSGSEIAGDPRMLRKLKLENLCAVVKFFKRERGGRRRLVIGHDKAERYITRVGIMRWLNEAR